MAKLLPVVDRGGVGCCGARVGGERGNNSVTDADVFFVCVFLSEIIKIVSIWQIF
jgi:hypothetical protein